MAHAVLETLQLIPILVELEQVGGTKMCDGC